MSVAAEERCDHCGAPGITAGRACYDCCVLCAGPGCDQPADPVVTYCSACLIGVRQHNARPFDG